MAIGNLASKIYFFTYSYQFEGPLQHGVVDEARIPLFVANGQPSQVEELRRKGKNSIFLSMLWVFVNVVVSSNE